ncbi:hypothetical protein C8Q80DRAFT_960344 [Daedaleopsis nitida]|nr:hypothetical protein C8Q80DRAFT_960344 [Daedaleopsis nitida]
MCLSDHEIRQSRRLEEGVRAHPQDHGACPRVSSKARPRAGGERDGGIRLSLPVTYEGALLANARGLEHMHHTPRPSWAGLLSAPYCLGFYGVSSGFVRNHSLHFQPAVISMLSPSLPKLPPTTPETPDGASSSLNLFSITPVSTAPGARFLPLALERPGSGRIRLFNFARQ